MDLDNLTFLAAVNRVNGLTDFYAKEKLRLEDNLTKLLLPAGLTFTAAMLKDAIDPKYVGAAIFLAAFFFIYALLIYRDLYAAERAYVNAFMLQSALYAHQDAKGSLPLREVASAQVLGDYRKVELGVGMQRYVMPTGKPLIAAIGGGAVLVFYWIV